MTQVRQYRMDYTICINLYKLVYNGELSNFDLLLLAQNSNNSAQILCGLSHEVRSNFIITKSVTTELLILILDISAIVHQLPYCYVVTTSKIGLYTYSVEGGGTQ